MQKQEENLRAYRSKFLRAKSLPELQEEAGKFGVESEGKGRAQLIEDIISKTSFRAMFEHVYDQIRRMTVASLKEQVAHWVGYRNYPLTVRIYGSRQVLGGEAWV